MADILHVLNENVGDSDEDETVYDVADNHCLPDNKVEVSQYTFLEPNVES